MTFWKSMGFGLGGLAAFFGRGPLAASYTRGTQYATDVYLQAWGVVFALMGIIGVNAFFMWMEWRGMQTMLMLLSFVVGMFYLFTPKIAVPLAGVGAAIRAGEEGDQANVWLVRDGFKDLVNNAGVVFFWIGVYILATIIVPFGMYMTFALLLHIPLVLMVALLMTGKVKVNPEVYEWAWKSLIALLVVGALTVLVFRENLGPWWVKHTANQASRVEATQQSEAIRQIDKMHAAWLEKHVRTEKGQRVITVKDAETGKMKVVDAAPYIVRKQKEREEALKALAPNSVEDGTASPGKAADGPPPFMSDPMGWTSWEVANEPRYFWGLVIGHILGIWLIKWLWGKRTTDATTVGKNVTTTKVVTPSSGSGMGTLFLVVLLGIAGYMLWDHPTVVKAMGRDAHGVYTKTVVLPSMTELNREKFTAQFNYVNAQVPLAQSMWHGREVTITPESFITAEKGVHVTLAFGEGNGSLDLALSGGKCALVSNLVPYVCEGTWRTERAGSPIGGYFRGEWNTQGTNMLLMMYKEDYRVEKGDALATILFLNKVKDVR